MKSNFYKIHMEGQEAAYRIIHRRIYGEGVNTPDLKLHCRVTRRDNHRSGVFSRLSQCSQKQLHGHIQENPWSTCSQMQLDYYLSPCTKSVQNRQESLKQDLKTQRPPLPKAAKVTHCMTQAQVRYLWEQPQRDRKQCHTLTRRLTWR